MIYIDALSKNYGEVRAVDAISLDIKRGEILGLLGPNGAGKTTTLRMLTCYLTPSSGDVRIKDFSIREQPLEIKGLIGYLPESAPLYPDMIVLDFLDFVANLRGLGSGERESRVRELAGLCGLSDVMHKSIHELSKGYKQRVGLAHALMGDPEILILDEPTSGLDPNQIREIRDLIREVGKRKTIILSTHILSEAEATCDRVVIINKGRIVADGAIERLKREAGRGFRISITLAHDDFGAVRNAFASVPGVSETFLGAAKDGIMELQVSGEADEDVRPALYEVIRESGWPLLEFHRQTRTLENIFRELTREH